MPTDITHAPSLDSAAALRGILALLAAARNGSASRRTEQILVQSGLSIDQIAAVTGHDAAHVRTVVEDRTPVVSSVREPSVIDRARAALTQRAAM